MKIIMQMMLVCWILSYSNLWGLEIVIPQQYTEVHPGDTVKVVVRPSPGEKVGSVFFEGLGGEVATPPYEYRYKVGQNQVGDIVLSIMAVKPESEGPFATADDAYSSEVELHLKSTLPTAVKIQSLRAEFDLDPIFMTVEKDKLTGNYLPKTGQLRVYALYSDGVERPASSASADMIYSSSNEKILTINADGIMTALTPGKVQITVLNGNYKIVLDASVLPK